MITAERPAQYVPTLFETDINALLSGLGVLVECTVKIPNQTLDNWTWQLFPVVDFTSHDWARGIADIVRRTQWSDRTLSRVLGTSHTTIGAITRGRPVDPRRSGDLADRLDEVNSVIARVYQAAGQNTTLTRRVLDHKPLDGLTASALLRARRPNLAYLVALDALKPRQQGLLVGDDRRLEDATAPLSD